MYARAYVNLFFLVCSYKTKNDRYTLPKQRMIGREEKKAFVFVFLFLTYI